MGEVTTQAAEEEEIAFTDVVNVRSEEEEEATEIPVVKPVETYLVSEVAETTTEIVLEETSTETYEEDPKGPAEPEDVTEEELPPIEPIENALNPRIVNVPVEVVEEVVVETKPVSGYWIEVSGDRDIIVTYKE